MFLRMILLSLLISSFGFFIEFEGEPEMIERHLDEFNLSNRTRITRAYLGLWEDLQKPTESLKKIVYSNKNPLYIPHVVDQKNYEGN